MTKAQRESELKQYLLSGEYLEEAIERWGEEEGSEYIERLRSKPHLLAHEVRTMLARDIERQASIRFDTDDPWRWKEDVWKEDNEGNRYHQVDGINPPAYGSCYFFSFLATILHGSAGNIYSYLDANFRGDYCDRLYLVSLLDEMDVAGYFDETKLLVWYCGVDGACAQYDVTPGSVIEGLLHGRSFRGSSENQKRAGIVRRWIADKAEVQDSIETKSEDGNHESEVTGNSIAFLGGFSQVKCNELAYRLGFTTITDQLKPEFSVGHIAGMVHVLKHEGYCKGQGKAVNILMALYGQERGDRLYSPDRDARGMLPKEFKSAVIDTANELRNMGLSVEGHYQIHDESWFPKKVRKKKVE